MLSSPVLLCNKVNSAYFYVNTVKQYPHGNWETISPWQLRWLGYLVYCSDRMNIISIAIWWHLINSMATKSRVNISLAMALKRHSVWWLSLFPWQRVSFFAGTSGGTFGTSLSCRALWQWAMRHRAEDLGWTCGVWTMTTQTCRQTHLTLLYILHLYWL